MFTETKDHSKLAISGDPNKPYVCIGDINRMVRFSGIIFRAMATIIIPYVVNFYIGLYRI